jgi:hypothetical protein
VTENPRRFPRRKSEPDTGSEPLHTSPTACEDLSEEDLQRRKFAWEDGDVETLYDPYAEKRRQRGQRP